MRRTDGSKCFTEHYDALDEDGREGGDEEWIVDDGVCADGGTVFGFFDASHRSRTIIHDASGTLTILTLSGR